MRRLSFILFLYPMFLLAQAKYTVDKSFIGQSPVVKPLNTNAIHLINKDIKNLRPVVQQGYTFTTRENGIEQRYINQIGFSPKEKFVVTFGADNVVRLVTMNGLLYSVMPVTVNSYDWPVVFSFDSEESHIALATAKRLDVNNDFYICSTDGNLICTFSAKYTRIEWMILNYKKKNLVVYGQYYVGNTDNKIIGSRAYDFEKKEWLNKWENEPLDNELEASKKTILKKNENVPMNESFFTSITINPWSRNGEVIYKTCPIVLKSPLNSYVATIFNKDKVPLKIFRPDGTFLKSYGESESIPQVLSYDISPDGNFIVARYQGLKMRVFDRYGFLIRTFPYENGADNISISPDGKLIALQYPSKIVIFDFNGIQKSTITPKFKKNGIESFCFTPDSKYIAASCDYGENTAVYDMNGILVKKLKIGMPTSFMAYSKDYSKFIAGSRDGVSAWEINDKGDLKEKKVVDNGLLIVDLKNFFSTASDFKGLVFPLHVVRIYSLNSASQNSSYSKSNDIFQDIINHRNFRYAAFHPDGNSLVICIDKNSLLLVDKNCNVIAKYEGVPSEVDYIKYSPDGSYFVISGTDGCMRIVDPATNHLTICAVRGDDWISCNDEGYFDASKNGGNLIAMAKGYEVYPIDQFAVKYNRPDMVMKTFASNNSALIDHYQYQYAKRLRRMGLSNDTSKFDLTLPIVEIVDYSQNEKNYRIACKFSDHESKVVRYNVFVNDVPLYGAVGKVLDKLNGEVFENIELCNGKNKIEVTCFNDKGLESLRAVNFAEYSNQVKTNLYILAFGVSKYQNPAYNLAYADKDAMDLSKVLETYKGKGFDNVYTKVLTNEQVTPEAIKAAKDFVKNAKPDDTFILFIAGHGMHDKDGEATYYYLTSNADVNNLKATAADFETIEDLLQGIPPRNKLFLMDACESGEIDEEDQGQMLTAAKGVGIASRGFKKVGTERVEVPAGAVSTSSTAAKRNYLYQKDRYIYNDLVRRSGAIVFSSSKGGELSYERSDIENGLFTEYIMKALTTTEADKDKNGTVSTDELREYVSTQVAKASGDLQHPTVDRDNIYQKFGFGLH